MLPLQWPDINWLISFENELSFTLRKLPRGNYGILKINSEEDPFLYILRLCRRDCPVVHGISLLWKFWTIPSEDPAPAAFSTTPRPRLHRLLLLLTVFLFLHHLCQRTPHLHPQCRPSCLWLLQILSHPSLHCSSFLLLSEKSSNLTERGGLWLNSRDIRHFTTILLTRTPPCPLPCLLSPWAPSLAWPSDLPGSGQQLQGGGGTSGRTEISYCWQLPPACYASLQQQ